MSVRTDTALHPTTVSAVSTGQVPVVRRRRSPRGVWMSKPETREQVPPALLASALEAAGGNANRLWFAVDGSVWVLNHGRMTSCPSPACPACQGGRRRTSRAA